MGWGAQRAPPRPSVQPRGCALSSALGVSVLPSQPAGDVGAHRDHRQLREDLQRHRVEGDSPMQHSPCPFGSVCRAQALSTSFPALATGGLGSGTRPAAAAPPHRAPELRVPLCHGCTGRAAACSSLRQGEWGGPFCPQQAWRGSLPLPAATSCLGRKGEPSLPEGCSLLCTDHPRRPFGGAGGRGLSLAQWELSPCSLATCDLAGTDCNSPANVNHLQHGH